MVTALSQDEIESGLVKKGFRRSHTDHRYFILYVNAKKEAATFLSHGKNQDIGSPLLNAHAKELGLTTRDFIDLEKCPFSTKELLAAKKDRLAKSMHILKEVKDFRAS